MPLDDVIAQKNKTIAELDKKISDFKVEIERLTVATRNKRAELTAEGSKTVDSLNAAIPSLRSEKSRLENEIKQLNTIVQDKLVASKKAEQNAAANYQQLEKSLTAEHAKRNADLNKHATSLHDLSAKLTQQAESLKSQQDAHNANVALHNKAVEDFKKKVADQDAYHSTVMSQIKDQRFKANNKTIAADARQKESLEKEKLVASQLEILKSKEAKANEILNRIDEAKTILAEANAKEAANKEKEARLNQQAVQLKADRSRLSAKEDAVTIRENNVIKREENIRVLEAKNG